MSHRFPHLIVAGLALSAGTGAAMSVSHDRQPGGVLEVVVDGVPQQRYAHDGRWYVEALKGREYAIRLHNPYGMRVAVALSVDGLNTIDGRHTTAAEARKWVLDPHETVVISGWQISRTEARRFEFTTEERSYAHALGRPANMGVISAVFFRERVRAVTPDVANEAQRSRAPAAAAEAAAAPRAGSAAPSGKSIADEYAATGMGRGTGHVVTQVWLDLEDAPAQTVNIRYEFRPQLVRLGILPAAPGSDSLQRRERAHGFEPGFCPEPRRRR